MATLTKMYFNVNNREHVNRLKFTVDYNAEKKCYEFWARFVQVEYPEWNKNIILESIVIMPGSVYINPFLLQSVKRRLGAKKENNLIKTGIELFIHFVKNDTETFLQGDKEKIIKLAQIALNNYSDGKGGEKNASN